MEKKDKEKDDIMERYVVGVRLCDWEWHVLGLVRFVTNPVEQASPVPAVDWVTLAPVVNGDNVVGVSVGQVLQVKQIRAKEKIIES